MEKEVLRHTHETTQNRSQQKPLLAPLAAQRSLPPTSAGASGQRGMDEELP